MNPLCSLRYLTFGSLLLFVAVSGLAQGPLTPPGAPAPTMKALSEVEPRTIVNATNTPGDSASAYVISQPGSYYLTGNVAVTGANGVVNGIKIYSDNVTLDLGGFTITSTNGSAAGSGVLVGGSAAGTANANITILNGSIKGTTAYTAVGSTYSGGGFANGISLAAASVANGRVSGVNVQGVGGAGISFQGGTVEKSNVNVATGAGIVGSVVTDSTAYTTGGTAITATAGSDVVGNSTGTGQDVIISGNGQPGGDRRTALAQNGTSIITIGSAGSYYLTGNVTVSSGIAINILSGNVTLDLNGFTVSSTSSSASGTAIAITGFGSAGRNVTIRNGQISSAGSVSGTTFTAGAGFVTGIGYGTFAPQNAKVENVNVQGVSGAGIDLGTDRSSVVTGCTVRAVGGQGIRAGAVADSAVIGSVGPFAIDAASASNSVGTLVSGAPNAVSGQRIPIATAPYTISAPGSYYLTGNLSVPTGNAISIMADNVSLDLNGFNITSTSSTANGDAININGRSGVSITNGTILSGSTVSGTTVTSGPGFVGGVNWAGTVPASIRVSGLTVVGVSGYAIDLGIDNTSVAQNCAVRIAGSTGIRAGTVSDSSATQCVSPITATSINDCVTSTPGGAVTAASTVATTTGVTGVQTSVNTANTNINTANSSLTTLQQTVGARTAIPASTSMVTLSSPGSYYLTGNVTVSTGNGIAIAASNVTLDLNGFTVSTTSTTLNGNGILVSGGAQTNLRICNGAVAGKRTNGNGTTSVTFSGGGFSNGINVGGMSALTIENVRVTGCGYGINDLSTSSRGVTLTQCMVFMIDGDGINVPGAVARDCYATYCRQYGITCAAAENCYADTLDSSITYTALNANTATNCRAVGYNSPGYGLYSQTATGCTAIIQATGGSSSTTALFAETAINCSATNYNSGSTGLQANTASYCLGNAVGVAIQARIAVGCTANTGTLSTTYRYLMP